MSTPQTAQIYITNTTDGNASITLWHQNSDYGKQQASWTAKPGQTVGPLTVNFNTGFGSLTVLDYWACEIHVTSGSTQGLFESSGVLEYTNWKECQLQKADAGKHLTFAVNSKTFNINLASGGTSTPMNTVDQVHAQVSVKNNSGSQAIITLFHNNSTDGTQSATWTAGPGQTVGPVTVNFRVGLNVAWALDYWALKMVIPSGPQAGVYYSNGSLTDADWKECQLQKADANRAMTFAVDTGTFNINVPSGGTSTSMRRIGPYTAIDHVFVLMLENHAFDNMFAASNIPGLTVATAKNNNTYLSATYAFSSPAPSAMPTDPGHEFADVLEQLCGKAAVTNRKPWTAYPAINNSGFVSNYATTTTEGPAPVESQWGEIMQGMNTQSQLPVIYQLATNFAICDHWHSSIPGPTWPNRFFVHGASSAGWADSPSTGDMVGWETPGGGFTYPSGKSIFDKVSDKSLKWRIYVDPTGPVAGGIPQVASLKGITYGVNTNSLGSFAADLKGPYPYTYTFIEPNYGNVINGSYTGGSSQHPMDSVAGGEALIKSVYEAIRNSPAWQRSLLIITYDEHGGFYDSVQPPAAQPPNDGSPQNLAINSKGFLFDRYGVRVPAVIVSPLIPKGTVDHTLYDHASVSATLNAFFSTGFMTQRDTHANTLNHLMSLSSPRTDCPTTLNNPASAPAVAALTPQAAQAALELAAAPLPTSGNAVGALQTIIKTDIALTRGDEAEIAVIQAKVAALKTVGQAEAYANEVAAKARLAGVALDAAAAAPPRSH